jgi:murein DD-endopeptidase MepM/ murein hydrolase activator NlpD
MKFQLTGEYGELAEVRNNIPHHGLDFAMSPGTELHSVMPGTVEKIVDYGSQNLGKGIFIRNDNGTLSIYGHMSKVSEKLHVGDHLNVGQTIGLSGNTGHVVGSGHLHYGMKDAAGRWMDPSPIAERVSNMQGDNVNLGQFLLDKYNHFADKVIGAEMNTLVKPAQHTLQDWLIALGHTLTDLMPEIGTGITIAAGIAIMFTGNFPKYFVRWGFAMLGVISWIVLAK